MAIPRDEWLGKAQALAVGQTRRTYHNEEHKQNLVVSNDYDRWWCYCHRCHDGATVYKEHVLVGQAPVQQERVMPWPADAAPLGADAQLTQSIYRMLAPKGIDLSVMLPGVPLMQSKAQGRLLVGTSQGWLGRALGNAQPKWCTYSSKAGPAVFAMHPHDRITPGCTVVLTEDFFSAAKIRWAGVSAVPVACLGTRVHSKLLLQLLGCAQVLIAFDGDSAGAAGYVSTAKRLRGLGLTVHRVAIPEGLDPKDMHAAALKEAVCLSSSTTRSATPVSCT